ncbi:aminoglycoside 6-adenylyltransferase [Paenibacillus physcomitrellae]|uniref:Aminoglycoside 6-adenylyltransferase n=1 Tax=Paenibacillus physcomitrellae TaxID=1619311 RepID=A0ABQ1GB65_9BACL|nr:aminoglycoside 6-adenylyltransferase [Paenibacillus physcomitrellae]GGA40273.1 aminoglycoside 6-adenylyltransferase [Paenibacillus physcomitrellae]
MRDEQTMMELILGAAREDERIRAVALNGSRSNPAAPRDIFQDYDIVYLVTEVQSFIQDPSWIDRFGERIMLQCPELMTLIPPEANGRFVYLMLLADGNRLDLRLIPLEQTEAYLLEDKLTVILMDKDHLIPECIVPTDEDYRVEPPTAELFANCCNEFWWVSTYVAKGLWRREILYAQDHLNMNVRPMLLKMLNWLAGIRTDFTVNTGKSSKYLQAYIPESDWERLLDTYAGSGYEDVWKALFTMAELFRSTAKQVAGHMQYDYLEEDDRKVYAYLQHVAVLPRDADSFGM